MSQNHTRSVFLKNKNGQDDLSVEKRIYNPKIALPDINHWHDYYEMELFPTGSGTHFLSGRKTNFGAGYMFLVTPRDFHRLKTDRENIEYYNITFTESALPRQISDFITARNAPCEVTLSEDEVNQIAGELEMIISESNSTDQFSNHMKKECFGKVLIIFCRALIRKTAKFDEIPDLYNSTVRRTMDIVQRDLDKNIGLTSVSAEIGYSPNYLGVLFKSETGVSFTEYLQNKRISYAENLLRISNFSIKEIAEMSGFASTSYFISIFKKKHGYTPSSLRKPSKNN